MCSLALADWCPKLEKQKTYSHLRHNMSFLKFIQTSPVVIWYPSVVSSYHVVSPVVIWCSSVLSCGVDHLSSCDILNMQDTTEHFGSPLVWPSVASRGILVWRRNCDILCRMISHDMLRRITNRSTLGPIKNVNGRRGVSDWLFSIQFKTLYFALGIYWHLECQIASEVRDFFFSTKNRILARWMPNRRINMFKWKKTYEKSKSNQNEFRCVFECVWSKKKNWHLRC